MSTEAIEYRDVVDKTAWGEGPWLHEPDKAQWEDPATGLPCLIVRNVHATGSLCGYVGVLPGHPLYNKSYDDAHETAPSLDVHGGLTFAAGCGHSPNPAFGVCHIPGEGEPDNVWWFGFDCGHLSDLSPKMQAALSAYRLPYPRLSEGDVYRDWAYVRAEVTALAAQLAAVRHGD